MATFSPEEVEQWIQHTDCSMQPFTTMILNGVTAVNELHKWEWLKNYQPKDGFMWSHSADVDQLTNKISELDSTHSGASMAALVRTLQHMAQDLLPPDQAILCSICLDEENSSPYCTLDCGHSYHNACLDGLRGRRCPLCRKETVPRQ